MQFVLAYMLTVLLYRNNFSKYLKAAYYFSGASRHKELLSWRLASLRQGGQTCVPAETRANGRQGHHPQHRRGGADQARAPHLRGGPQAHRGVGSQTPAANLNLDHVAGPG